MGRSTEPLVKVPDLQTLLDLVRFPAALSIPGDTLVGAAASNCRANPLQRGALIASSCCLYWAGMALNDYCDRKVDAEERPHRPIPAGRVTPLFALCLAASLTAAGVGIARVAGGRRAGLAAGLVAASVWTYDMRLKGTKWGPASMAACRSLDVMMGASLGNPIRALPSAAVIGAHTLTLTNVSSHEVEGASSSVPQLALSATGTLTAAVAGLIDAWSSRSNTFARVVRTITAAPLLGLFAVPVLKAEQEAIQNPTPAALQKVVGTSLLAMIPLQGSLLAARGRIITAAVVSAGWPLARQLSRRRSVT